MERLLRMLVLAGGAIAFGALWLPWYYTDDGPTTFDAWEVFVHADTTFAVAALVLAAPAALPARFVGATAPVAAAVAWLMTGLCLDRIWAFSTSVPFPAYTRVGPYVGTAGFALCALGWSLASIRRRRSSDQGR